MNILLGWKNIWNVLDKCLDYRYLEERRLEGQEENNKNITETTRSSIVSKVQISNPQKKINSRIPSYTPPKRKIQRSR